MPRPEPQNGIALPPLDVTFEDRENACKMWPGVWPSKQMALAERLCRERQLLSRMQSLARIHALALEYKEISEQPAKGAFSEIVRLSNANAAE